MKTLVSEKPGRTSIQTIHEPTLLGPTAFGDLQQAIVQGLPGAVGPLEEAANALRSWSENPSQFKKILVSLD